MTNSKALFEAFVNVSHTVLGVRLKPLCLLHLLWLYEIDSPLVYTSQATTLADLEVAVTICSNDSNEAIVKALDGKELNLWHRIRRNRWFRKNKKRDLQTELKAFLHYNDDFAALPRFAEPDESSSEIEVKNIPIPWLLLHAAQAIKQTGWSEQTVFTLPLGKLLWLNTAFSYLETGQTNVVSDKEQNCIDALRAMNALTGDGKE